MAAADAWIDLIIKRSAELRRAGILSIGCDGNSAVFAPAEPEADDDKDDSGRVTQEAETPANAWEDPASYPSGNVPSISDVTPAAELPEIPQFGDD